jgi:multidrug efflux pump subunit AcrA (membrane-fusion protein)
MNIKRNHALALSAIPLVIACLATVLSHHGRSIAAESTKPFDVDVATVISTTVTDYQQYSGRTEAIDRVEIRPLVSGTIVGVHFTDGALVKRGDLLFTIDPRPFVAEVDRATAELAAARARDGYASTDAVRAQHLLTDNAIAKRDFDRAQNAALEAAANVLSAQAAVLLALNPPRSMTYSNGPAAPSSWDHSLAVPLRYRFSMVAAARAILHAHGPPTRSMLTITVSGYWWRFAKSKTASRIYAFFETRR